MRKDIGGAPRPSTCWQRARAIRKTWSDVSTGRAPAIRKAWTRPVYLAAAIKKSLKQVRQISL